MADLKLDDIDAELKRRAGASAGAQPQQAPSQPVDMSLSDVNAALQQNGLQQLPQGTPVDQSQPQPQLPAMGRFHKVDTSSPDAPSYERFGQGLRDPLDAGAQLLTKFLPNGVVSGVNYLTQYINDLPVIGSATKALGMVPATNAEINQNITDREKSYQHERGDNAGKFDAYRLLGNITANAPLAYVLPGAGARTIGGTMLAGGTAGAASGALTPVQDANNPDQDFWAQKANQVGVGSILGALTGGLIKGGQKVLSPTVAPNVRLLMSKGVTPTPGQIIGPNAAAFEDKLTSIPVVGDLIKNAQRRAVTQFDRASYNEALNPVGVQAGPDVGRVGVQNVKDTLSDAYNTLLPRMTWQADNQFLGDIGNIAQNAQMLPPIQQKQLATIWQLKIAPRMQNGQMSGDTFKALEEELRPIIDSKKAAGGDQADLGNELSNIMAAFRGGLQRTNPQFADELANINLGYANYARIRQAAGSLGAQDGIYTPAQLLNAVKAGDKSAGKGNYATGNALMQDLAEAGKNVLGQKIPDSGTPGRQMAAALTGLLAGGGLGYVSPLGAVVSALGASAYTPAGQRILAALLAGQRSQATTQLASILGKASPAISQATVAGLLSPARGGNP